MAKRECKVLSTTVTISRQPPAAGECPVLPRRRLAVQRSLVPLIDTAELREQAADNRLIQRALGDGLPALEGVVAQMTHGQPVDHECRPFSLSAWAMTRRRCLAPSVTGNSVFGASLTPSR